MIMEDFYYDYFEISKAERNFCAMQSAMGKLRECAESMKVALDACRRVSVNDLSEEDLTAFSGCVDSWERLSADMSDCLSEVSKRYVDVVMGRILIM